MTGPKCRISFVGKRRDGGSRYWCMEHRADATAKYGRRARRCRYAHLSPVSDAEILDLDLKKYLGGVALWGAVPPIYDTTSAAIDRGVHVHARITANDDKKDIDETFRAVRLFDGEGNLLTEISELDAIYHMVSMTFGFKMKYVECAFCGFPHLDKDWFSVHPHRRHLCAGCGKQFRDSERGIGNPTVKIRSMFPVSQPQLAPEPLDIMQTDYPGGIQIWASNPALVWTSPRNEHAGIHIHAFKDDTSEPAFDETYYSVTIDGVKLDARLVRALMAQNALPHIAGRIISLRCPNCGRSHAEKGEAAFTPHDPHTCHRCNFEFRSHKRFRKTISNPILDVLERLSETAVRAPQQPRSNLIPETL